MEAGVGEDLAGAVVDLAGGKQDRANDGKRNDDRLQDDRADEPPDDGAAGVFL